ncbi:MAG: glutamate-cysteine ligase family protein [Myxococcota bacterium]
MSVVDHDDASAEATTVSPPLRGEDLERPFARSGPRREWLGTESEKFGVLRPNATPVSYDGRTCGIVQIFDGLMARGDWAPYREREGGPVVALSKVGGSTVISLEPGAQLELSGAPVETVHDVEAELAEHLADIAPVSETCGIDWLAVGYHPFARPEQLPWVPKERYEIMRAYFPRVGTRGLDMMRRTATVQVNLDYHDEEDAMRKLRVALKLSPIATAIFANSPFAEGRAHGWRSERAHVWLDTDRDRAGLLEALMEPGRRYRDYVAWALDVPMYFIKRGGRVVANTGQSFRDFRDRGYEGHRARYDDWLLHLNTLFPEVRLQKTLEVRSADMQSVQHLAALPAFWAGLMYDETSLAAAEALVARWSPSALVAARPLIAREALNAELCGRPVRHWAERVMALALEGLSRRGRRDEAGRDERRHLEPLAALVAAGRCPADDLLDGLDREQDPRAAILRRTRVDFDALPIRRDRV